MIKWQRVDQAGMREIARQVAQMPEIEQQDDDEAEEVGGLQVRRDRWVRPGIRHMNLLHLNVAAAVRKRGVNPMVAVSRKPAVRLHRQQAGPCAMADLRGDASAWRAGSEGASGARGLPPQQV